MFDLQFKFEFDFDMAVKFGSEIETDIFDGGSCGEI